jgi:hypothetical protein
LFIMLLYWIYKASQEKSFQVWELMKIWKMDKIIDINWDWKLDEKDKLTLILSYIPFIWYITQWKYFNNYFIKSIIKFNLIISVLISVIYIFWNTNITLLFILFYLIFSVFSSINIIVRDKIVWINLPFIPNIWEILSYFKIFILYLKNYFWNKTFIWFKEVKNNYIIKIKNTEIKNQEIIKKLNNSKFPNFLIYLPFINLFWIFFLKSNKKFHIINGIMITIFFIIFAVLNSFNYIPNSSYILLLFPIFFWLWYINSRPAYKIPIIFDLFELLISIKSIFIKTKKDIQEKKEEEHSEVMKVWKIKKSTES